MAGGMLAAGIPSFRLPRPLLNAELDRLRAIGIEILLDTPVGRSITFEELRKSYAAVFVAIGAHVERRLGIPGENLPGVTGGVEFLRRVNLGIRSRRGMHVLVVGGGNSALDAARAALRCGAAEVTIVYRRTRAEMPADHREIEDAEREGVKLMFLAAPKSFQSGPDGRVAGLECLKMKLGEPDASGRPAPEPIPGSEFVIPCDAVVATIGQVPDVNGLGERLGLATTKSGTLRADPLTLETELPGVFAGGDCVTGPDVVVTAMLAGKKAANSIDRWLNEPRSPCGARTGRAVSHSVRRGHGWRADAAPDTRCKPSTPRLAEERLPKSTSATRRKKRSPRPSAVSRAASAAIVISAQRPARPMRSTMHRKRRLRS